MTSPGDDPKAGADRNTGTGSADQQAKGSAQDDEAGRSASGKSGETLSAAVLGLSKLCAESGKDGVSPRVTDAVTQALLLILGSGPSIVAFEGLLSAQNSSGLMYHNAVSNQQKTNLLGMAMTAKCVRYMLDPYPDDVIDEAIFGGDAE